MSDTPKNKGSGAEDLLSKLFDMEGDLNSSSSTNFGESTKIDPLLQTQAKAEPKKSLDDLLRGDPKTEVQEPSIAAEDDLFAGILVDDKGIDEQISVFDQSNTKTDSKPAPNTDTTELISEIKPSANPFDSSGSRTVVLEALDSEVDEGATSVKTLENAPEADSATVDPIEAALVDFGESEQASSSSNVEAVTGSKKKEPSLKQSDFAEGFAHQPIAVSGISFQNQSPMKIFVKKWGALSVAVVGLCVFSLYAFSKIQTDEGFLGYRLEGFNLVKAYRPPSEEQSKAFQKTFSEVQSTRFEDDPKKMEEGIGALHRILEADERNLRAVALLMEQAAILNAWMGVKSQWPQRYEEFAQIWNTIIEKVKTAEIPQAYERAKAWRSLSIGESKRAYTELQAAVSKFAQVEPETATLMAELALLSEDKPNAEKWLKSLGETLNRRARFISALLNGDLKQISALAAEGYAPAKVEELLLQKMTKESSAQDLARVEALMVELKDYVPLIDKLRVLKGNIFELQDNHEKARAEWKQVLQNNTRRPGLWIQLAFSYENDALWDDALAAYREAEKQKGLNLESTIRYSRLLRARGKVLDAVSLLDESIKNAPTEASLFYEKGMLQIAINQEDPARASFLKALEINAAYEPAILGLVKLSLNRKDWVEAENLLKKISPKSPQYSDALVNLGRIAKSRYQFQQADHYFLKAIEENPKLESAYFELEEMYLEDEKGSLAQELVEKGLKALPKSQTLKVAMARVDQFQGRFQKALTDIDAVYKTHGHLPEVAATTADVLLDNREFARAYEVMAGIGERDAKSPELQYLRAKAFVMDPEGSKNVGSLEAAYRGLELSLVKSPENTRYRLMAAQIALLLQDKNGATEHLDAILKVHPNYSQALLIRGDLLRDSGDYEGANQKYLAALKANRFQDQIYSRLAEGFKAQGKASEAIEFYKKVVATNAMDARAHMELGKLYSDEGRYAAALKSLRASVRINPNVAEPYYFLGFVEKELGNNSGAIEAFEKFLKLSPNGTEANTVRDEVFFLKKSQ